MDKTIAEIIEEVKVAMCNDYCKFHEIWDEETEGATLEDTKCVDCPLGRLG